MPVLACAIIPILSVALLVAGCGSPPSSVPEPVFQFEDDADPILGALAYVDDELLIEIFPGADPDDIAELLEQLDAIVIEDLSDLDELDLSVLGVSPEDLEAIAGELDASDLIESVQKNYLFESDQAPDDPLYAAQQYLEQIRVPAAWDIALGSEAVTIAVVDSGVDISHPDLVDRIAGGWNIYSNNGDYNDLTGHGTKVAGVAGAATNNAIGVAGVTWSAPLLAVRVTDDRGRASARHLAAGILWSVNNGAKVINVSFAPLWSNSVVRWAAERAWARGAIVVISTGNDSGVSGSGGYEQALFVGAVGGDNLIAPFSDRGPFVDLVAPGVGIRTTGLAGDYPLATGTSFAAPIVAGVIGLAWSVNPQLRTTTLADTLLDTAVDLGEQGEDGIYGRGLVDAVAAVTAASQAVFVPDGSPPTVSVMAPLDGATLRGRTLAEVVATDDWGVDFVRMSIDGMAAGTDKRSPYRFAIDARKFVDGAHEVSFMATDLAGNVGMPVTVSVTFAGDALDPAETSAPSVRFTAPTAESTVVDAVTISAIAAADQGLSAIEWLIDGTSVLSGSISGVSSAVGFRWSPVGIAPGPHTITLVVTAADGAVAEATLILLTD